MDLRGMILLRLIISKGPSFFVARGLTFEYLKVIIKKGVIWKGVRSMNKNSVGRSWDEFEKEIYTPEEIAESDLRVAIMCDLINARNERGLSQRDLEELTGVKQAVISRIERGSVNPQLGTVLKLLAAMGKTLAVVPVSSVKVNR